MMIAIITILSFLMMGQGGNGMGCFGGFLGGIGVGLVVIILLLFSDFTKKEVFVTTNLDNVCVIDKEVMQKLMFVMKPAEEGEDNE